MPWEIKVRKTQDLKDDKLEHKSKIEELSKLIRNETSDVIVAQYNVLKALQLSQLRREHASEYAQSANAYAQQASHMVKMPSQSTLSATRLPAAAVCRRSVLPPLPAGCQHRVHP